MKLSFIFDKALIQSLLLSIISYIYSKFILFIITNVSDSHLMYVIKPYIYTKNPDDSDESDDSDSDEIIQSNNDIINHNTLEEYNTYLRLWEYDILLHLFQLEKYSYNILSSIEKNKIKSIDNILNSSQIFKRYNSKNNIVIVNCFLFNIKVSKTKINLINKGFNNNIQLLSIYPFQYKLAIFSYISNNYINSEVLSKLFPNHKYIYILYKKDIDYKYVLVDLHYNYDIIKHKKILFNKIILY